MVTQVRRLCARVCREEECPDGTCVWQLIKDYEDFKAVNQQLDNMCVSC